VLVVRSRWRGSTRVCDLIRQRGGAYGAEDGSLLASLGAVITIFVLVALVSSAVLPLRAGWGVIAVRVLGSWTAATGLLLVGWMLHGRS
jgi:hypothetical protein